MSALTLLFCLMGPYGMVMDWTATVPACQREAHRLLHRMPDAHDCGCYPPTEGP